MSNLLTADVSTTLSYAAKNTKCDVEQPAIHQKERETVRWMNVDIVSWTVARQQASVLP